MRLVGHGILAPIVIRLHVETEEFPELVCASHVLSVNPDLRNGNWSLRPDDGLDPADHLVERSRILDHVVIHVVDARFGEISFRPRAMRAGRLAVEVVAGHAGASPRAKR